MTDNPLLTQTKMMLEATRTLGHIPLAFAMNIRTASTLARLSDTGRSERSSVLRRVIAYLKPQQEPVPISTLHGLLVEIDAELPDGVVGLKTARPAGAVLGTAASFQKQDPGSASEEVPKLDDLAGANGKVLPSDVLMKAFDGVDHIKHVVVVRVHENNDVDLCLDCDTFAAQGILQKAQYFLAARG